MKNKTPKILLSCVNGITYLLNYIARNRMANIKVRIYIFPRKNENLELKSAVITVPDLKLNFAFI
jgi:TnpA family transposase